MCARTHLTVSSYSIHACVKWESQVGCNVMYHSCASLPSSLLAIQTQENYVCSTSAKLPVNQSTGFCFVDSLRKRGSSIIPVLFCPLGTVQETALE